MQFSSNQINPCLWFDTEAEEAAKFYCSVFSDSSLGNITRYVDAGQDKHGKEAGSVMVAEFEIQGMKFIALNGGPDFKFTEAISFQIHCDRQEGIDYFWDRLTEGGQEVQCGWLKDKYGLSWQVVPSVLPKMLADPDRTKAERVTAAFMQMKKFDIAALERAYAG